MPKFGAVTQRELIEGLKKFSFKGPYAGGKHLFMIKDNLTLTIPNPHRSEIGLALLRRLLKQAGISRKEWQRK